MRAGARTGYVIPGRDGIGGLDPARNSSAVAAAAAVVRGEGEGFEILVTLAPYCMPTGRAMEGIIRVCWDYKSMLGL